ncbi:MAG: single-stranded DNA-binding protein [Armatimonadota bacterium]
MINTAVLVGRLGNDPELTYTQSGTAIAKFRLAVNRPPRRDSDQEETDWLDIVTFGRTAENCAQYLDKGALVGVEGRVQSRTWERQDGSRAYSVEINAYRVQFLESRQVAEERRQQMGAGAPAGQQRPPQSEAQAEQGPPQQGQQQPSEPQGGPSVDWAMDEDEDPFGDQ